MKVLIEQYSYNHRTLESMLDSHYYCERDSGMVQVPYVGYFLSQKIPDTIFILPKVFMIDGKAFGKYTPEEIVDFEKLIEDDKKTIFSLSVWIYRAIKLYLQRKSRFADEAEIMQNVVSHHGDSSETMIDIVLSLLKFQREHQNLFTFITKLQHSGNNKIHWQKTISGTQAFIQNGHPVYLTPKTKQKEVNFDEELIVLFYSVINYLNTEYHFNTRPVFGYELITPTKVKNMISSGKGTRTLRQNRRKYFTDEMVALWNLLFTFFSESEKVENKQNFNEQAMLVRDFNLVFEDMIDSLIGEENLPNGLKEQKDGKIIDHIYRDHSLIDAKDDIYFIGDSKYYKEENEVKGNSIYKQFTYARNVIQHNIDFFNKNGKYEEGLMYRDDVTEGYNITPNFFIRGNLEKDTLNNYTDDKLKKIGDDHVSYHFENRLFDRDTLILQTYNINFLFVLSAYVQGARQHTNRIRNVFRDNVMKVLCDKDGQKGKYKFYAMTPHEGVSASLYFEEHFQQILGKVFAPFADREEQKYFSFALDNDDKYKEENATLLSQLEMAFYIKECALGTAPYDILPKVDTVSKPVLPTRLLPIHFLENYADKNILIGGYHDKAHLDWIQGKNDKGTFIYNIRLNKAREGHLPKAQIERYASPIVILYHIAHPEDGYIVYHVHHNATINQERMAKTLYPREPKGNYYCYVFDDEISIGKLDIDGLLEYGKQKMEEEGKYEEGMPLFVKGEKIIEFRTAII